MSLKEMVSEEMFSKFISSEKPTVVLFSAEWAEQCKQVKDVLSEIAKLQEDKLEYCFLQAQDLPEISLKYQIEAVPTVLFFIKGEVVNRVDGANASLITAECNKLASKNEESGSLNDRLHALINKANVMIFMKGSRDAPRCGFSKQLISIMNDTNIDYETFDILMDEDVRQGLKTYSDWPTYPQVYVKGELIGGLDIVKELVANDELEGVLKGE